MKIDIRSKICLKNTTFRRIGMYEITRFFYFELIMLHFYTKTRFDKKALLHAKIFETFF